MIRRWRLTRIYLMFVVLLGWMLLRSRSDATRDVEILVLHHQLAVLQRRTPRPRVSGTDRALIAAFARLLAARRRLELIVMGCTILCWHRQLLTRAGPPRLSGQVIPPSLLRGQIREGPGLTGNSGSA